MPSQDNLAADGTTNFGLGQDAWTRPDAIQPNQIARGINVSCRGGALSPRNGYHQVDLVFEDKKLESDFGHFLSYKSLFETGKFQAAIYQHVAPEKYIIYVISGLIFRLNVRTRAVTLLSTKIKVSQTHDRINWSYADKYIELFDAPDYPVIIKGDDVSRKTLTPIATNGAYNSNRLFITNGNDEFSAGDPTGSQAAPDAPISFLEVLTPSSPFYRDFLVLPENATNSPITAMGFLPQLDSSTGVGPLMVATESRIVFCKTNQPRDRWKSGEFAATVLANTGIAGPRAFVAVNSDMIFMSGAGKIHALSNARNAAKRWGNIPISREVDTFIKFHDKALRALTVCGYFENRIFISVNPYRAPALNRNRMVVNDYAHAGMVVIEVEDLATFLREGTPVWAGLWTGIDVMDITNTVDQCFMISKDGGTNGVYELRPDATFDIVSKHKRLVRSIIYSKEYDFGDKFLQKRERSTTLHVRDLGGEVKINLERLPQHSHKFLRWGEWRYNAPIESRYMPIGNEALYGFAAHQPKEVVFGDPVEIGYDPQGNDLATWRSLQLRMTLEAETWTLEAFRIQAEPMPVSENLLLENYEQGGVVRLPLQPEPDWLLPEVMLCP